jgi:transposase
MMDKIDEQAIRSIQEQVSKYNKQLLKGKIQVLFYDVTTIYFESFTTDELKALGYSKDCKFNQPQIVLTLLVTEQGLPLGYQLLPGNTYEGNTLLTAIEKWRKAYPKEQFVLVADSGLLNNTNLEVLERQNIDYIVCARLKNLPKTTKQEILQFKEASDLEQDFYFDWNFKERRLIISYKYARAKKDRYDRENTVAKLISKLKISKNPSSLISNYGYKKYITIAGKEQIQLAEEKITEESHWDGLHGIITNIKGMTPEFVYSKYKDLWQIEDSFRINKTDLKIRPIFHWTPNRIKSHIAISYITYSCYKAVEFTVKQQGLELSHRQIKERLNKVAAGIFEDRYSKELFFVPEPISDEAYQIYKAFGLKLKDEPYCCTLQMQN